MTSDARRRHRRAVSDGPMLDLLKRVSRSFYLTMRVLPPDMRRPVGAAYLLARAADIIADTRAVHSPGRLEVLRALRNSIEHGTGFGAVEMSMMSAQASIDERPSGRRRRACERSSDDSSAGLGLGARHRHTAY